MTEGFIGGTELIGANPLSTVPAPNPPVVEETLQILQVPTVDAPAWGIDVNNDNHINTPSPNKDAALLVKPLNNNFETQIGGSFATTLPLGCFGPFPMPLNNIRFLAQACF